MTTTPPAPLSAVDASIDDPLVLPEPWSPPQRPPIPVLAAIVPVFGALAIWLVTGSVLALWLAGLGPLIAGATVLDGLRASRRGRRKALRESARAQERVRVAVHARHDAERRRLRRLLPDVAGFLAEPAEIWRTVRDRDNAVTIGTGRVRSSVRVSGGGDAHEAAMLRAHGARLDDAPVSIGVDRGIAVLGPPVLAPAVARALALQLCMVLPPDRLRVLGDGAVEPWIVSCPHNRADAEHTLAVASAGSPMPAGADLRIGSFPGATAAPPGYAVVLRVHGLSDAELTVDGDTQHVAPEAVGLVQAELVARALADRARVSGVHTDHGPVHFADLHAPSTSRPAGLNAAIGRDDHGRVEVDLVSDGPHAVVAGVTGSGKSELLTTWVVALCAAYATSQVSFLLADFKGGTTFDSLIELPHVTGVITDLDGAGANRAIESLRAEIRLRERTLAAAGVRDLGDLPEVPGVPRLVIVVDEFAALVGEQPDLYQVFADVAARGRALGMHLILGTQRVTGAIRDGLLTNCPLRLSLRVTDAADSRATIGTAAAAEVVGGVEGRGIAFLRRAGDTEPLRVRIALCAADDITSVIAASTGPSPRRPWLPPLPTELPLAALPPAEAGVIPLGLADEPGSQRQLTVGVRRSDRALLVVGSGGAGKSTALEVLAAAGAGDTATPPGALIRIPAEPEAAWDAFERLDQRCPQPGALILIDDLDAILARYPHEYAVEVVERVQRIVRRAGSDDCLIAVSARRIAGPVARVAELIPRRLVLATVSRSDHLDAGGDPRTFVPDAPAGRGTFEGRVVQVAIPSAIWAPHDGHEEIGAAWQPVATITGVIAYPTPMTRGVLTAWERAGAVQVPVDEFDARPATPGDRRVVVVGDPDQWQRSWRVLSEIRAEHDLVCDVALAAEVRLLTGWRRLLPYAEHGRARAWLWRSGADPVRVCLASER